MLSALLSTLLFFCLLKIRSSYKNNNSTKNMILWTILFGTLNYIIIFLCKIKKIKIEEGLALNIPFPPVYDAATKSLNASVNIKDVNGKVSAMFDSVNKVITVNIDDGLMTAILPPGLSGPVGAAGIAGAPGMDGKMGPQGIPGPPAHFEIRNVK